MNSDRENGGCPPSLPITPFSWGPGGWKPQGLSWVKEQVLVQEAWQQRERLLFHLRFHGDLFAATGIGDGILGVSLPLQPVCDHVPFPLRDGPAWLNRFWCSHWPTEARRRYSPWPAGFPCTPTHSHQSPPASRRPRSCTESSGLKTQSHHHIQLKPPSSTFYSPRLVDSILEAVLTVSPNKQ